MRDNKAQTIVLDRFSRMQLGNFGDYRHLGLGIYELRIHYDPGFRVYFGDFDKVLIVLFCGGTKGSQSRDTKRAKEYLREFNGQ